VPGNSVSHGTFTVEREYPFSPETVFAAWTTTEAKRGWFAQGDDFLKTVHEYGLDFRVGGVERLDADLVSGNRLTLETRYCDIVDSERIVATYDVLVNGRRISVSLFSMQLVPTDAGTRLVTTEHGAFLDGLDNPDQRRLGIESDLDQLAGYLERTQAAIISV
jgi:uncharacterized protein YndB with AHSA1/START domain